MTRDAIDGCREKKSNESPPPIQERRSFEEHNAAVIVMRNAHTGGPQRQLKMTLRILLTSLLCCTCILTQSSLGQEEQTANGVRTIQGTVLNSVTRAPIARALVSSGNRIGALTDSEGHFEFAWPDENSFSGLRRAGSWLNASKPGYLDDPRGRSRIQSVATVDLILYLQPESLITGRVFLAGNEPATGIIVHLYRRDVQNGVFRWMLRSQMQANSNGDFRFAELLPGAYKLLTQEFMDNDPLLKAPNGQLYGYPPVYFPNAADFASANTIQLTAGQIFQADISVIRQPYFDARIPIANPDFNNAMSVNVLPRGNRSPGYSLGYNRQKQRIDGSLPNGNYLVEASSFGPTPRNGMVNLSIVGTAAEGPALVLVPDASINVNVREEFTSTQQNDTGSFSDGQRTYTFRGARTYLQISALSADEFAPHRAGNLRDPSRQNDDSLVLEGLSPGRYWLQLSTSRGYVASASMGGVDLLHQPFTIASGSTTPIEITMRDDTAEIDGKVAGLNPVTNPSSGVVNATGPGPNTFAPGSPAYIYCIPLPDSAGQFQEFGLSSDGTFTSQAMAPGTYRVMAFDHQQADIPYRDAEAMRAYETKGQVIHLSPGQKTSVELQLITDSD
jgi:hypothetical protein